MLYVSKSFKVLICLALFTVVSIGFGLSDTDESKNGKEDVADKLADRPIVIWHFSGENKSSRSLDDVLASGLVTHVMISYRSSQDGLWYSQKAVREAIKKVKESDAKLIWSRSVWEWYIIDRAKYEDLYDPNHYIAVIKKVKAEANEMGADFTSLDVEPYGNSPMKIFFKGKDRIRLDQSKVEILINVVEEAVKSAGKVDFVLPAGSLDKNNPYNYLSLLGKNRISEHTYYDYSSPVSNIKYEYEIAGMYVRLSKENIERPKIQFYIVPEVFERSDLWSDRKGVLIYTRSSESLIIARQLKEYSETLPVCMATDPNSPAALPK